MFKKIKKILIPLICILIMCGCAEPVKQNKNKLNIVTTVFPLYDFARAIGGDKVNVTMLIDPGTEVHSFDPSPSDISAICNADLFLMIGGESEEWAKTVLADTDVLSVSMMDNVPLIAEAGSSEYDEHIWTSPSNAVTILRTIANKLLSIDADNAEFYNRNLDAYISRIKSASERIWEIVKKCDSPFILMADRFPFQYFVAEYGIKYKAAFDGCAANTDISAKTMSELLQTIKDKNCRYVYTVEMSNKQIAKALAEQTGVSILELHSAHNVSKKDFDSGITYIDLLQRNTAALEEGMQ